MSATLAFTRKLSDTNNNNNSTSPSYGKNLMKSEKTSSGGMDTDSFISDNMVYTEDEVEVISGNSRFGEEEKPPAVVLATGGFDHTIRFWDVVSGVGIGILQHNESHINCLAISRDKLLLAAGGNPAIRVYDTINATRSDIDSVAISTGSNEPPLHIFEVSNGGGNGPVPTGNIMSMGFGPTDEWIWSLSEDGNIRIWDVMGPSFGLKKEINTKCTPTAAILLSINTFMMVFVGDQSGRLRGWDLRRSKAISSCNLTDLVCKSSGVMPCAINSLSHSPDLKYLAAIDHSGRLYLWSIHLTMPNNHKSTDEATSRTEEEELYPPSENQTPNGVVLETLAVVEAHKSYGLRCKFSPDGRHLLTCGADSTAKLWTIDRVKENESGGVEGSKFKCDLYRTLIGHSQWVWDGAFSADGAYLVTASSDNTARLWDISTGEAIAVYSGHGKAIISVALNDLPSN